MLYQKVIPVAYGRNARYDSTIAWVSQVYTAPRHRRMGHASALMEQLLMDSVSAGVAQSLLLATQWLVHSMPGWDIEIWQRLPSCKRRLRFCGAARVEETDPKSRQAIGEQTERDLHT
jgi:GNAT superfamily N-acetyltransferase